MFVYVYVFILSDLDHHGRHHPLSFPVPRPPNVPPAGEEDSGELRGEVSCDDGPGIQTASPLHLLLFLPLPEEW